MKDASKAMSPKDYTKRPNVIRYLPWWLDKINTTTWTLEHCIALLKANKVTYIDRKDCKGIIQALEAHFELGNNKA